MDSLDSCLSIAESTAFAHYRGIEEHVENDNHEEYGDPRNTGRRGQQAEAKTKSLLWPHSIGIGGHTPEIQKGAKTSNSGMERNAIRYTATVKMLTAPPLYIHPRCLIQ